MLFFNGGMGATGSNDGQSTYAWPSNVSNVPVELIERNSPLFVHARSCARAAAARAGSAAGSARRSSSRSTSDTPVGIIFMAERCRFPAPGMQGGEAGARGEVRIDGAEVDYRKNVVLNKGQRMLLSTPGGGGVGAPMEREPAAAERDRREGYAS